MLKIKDNVDLKKLEKFGFEGDELQWLYYGFTTQHPFSELRIYINKETRLISTEIDAFTSPYKVHDKIYDLIQAGLVEKVE